MHLRDDWPRTPSGPEGSSGSSFKSGAEVLLARVASQKTTRPRRSAAKLKNMSYIVLARKWRPKRFAEMVGQEHVLRALANALDSGKVHHAFLFTGTRGVGKTTIARILAKSLNCETAGVSSNPCGVCAACREIDEGRFVDLIEVDAASRTKVDDTRELLDNVQYAPTRGRYKVYLIDEVHMLSNHSFNALLKTLRGTSAARQIPAGNHRPAETAGDRAVALPAVQPQTLAGVPHRRTLEVHCRRRRNCSSSRQRRRCWRAPPMAACVTH